MSIHAASVARQASHQLSDNAAFQQLQQQQHVAQQQQFAGASPYANNPAQFQQQHLHQQQRAMTPMQQRMPGDQVLQGLPGMQHGLPNQPVQYSPSYLQAQIMRQRQAAATAAVNWAAQQERSGIAASAAGTQRLGSAILRLLNFSEQLNSFSDSSSIEAWQRFVDEFYIDPALCTQSLPSNPELSYELPTPLLPAYYHQMHKEIAKLNLTFHDAREYYLPPNNHVVECPKCTMCYYFPNATKIEILGKLRIVYTPGPPPNTSLKMESWEFTAEEWDEWICRMPPPPIKQQGDDEENYVDALGGEAPEKDKETAKNTEKTGSEESEKEDDNENDDDGADHEDLFGRSPTGSNQGPTSRPESHTSEAPDDHLDEDSLQKPEDEKTKDPNKRARMVMQSGVTARHMRFLEISDVLGQISPLFGPKNPKETLKNLLLNLPAVDTIQDDRRKKKTKDTVQPSSKSAQQHNGRNEIRSTSQKLQQIQTGRAMQQQAAQVLQKQAAQTLSQALPPPNFGFDETDKFDTGFQTAERTSHQGEGEDEEEVGDEDEEDDDEIEKDAVMSKRSNGSTTTSSVNNIKVEDREEIDDMGVVGEIDIDLGLDADSADEQDMESDLLKSFPIGTADGSGLKRPGDESAGQIKRARNSDGF